MDNRIENVVDLVASASRLAYYTLRNQPPHHAVPKAFSSELSAQTGPQDRIAAFPSEDFTNRGEYPFVLTEVVIPAFFIDSAPTTAPDGVKLIVDDRQTRGPRTNRVFGGQSGIDLYCMWGGVNVAATGVGMLPGGGYEIPPNGGFDVKLRFSQTQSSALTVRIELRGYWKVES